MDIARIKEAAEQPIDEAEIQRRPKVRNALRDDTLIAKAFSGNDATCAAVARLKEDDSSIL